MVMDDGEDGCGEYRSWPVCSKPAGNTPEGLCDMAGNVYEWVQDCYHDSYEGAPTDGSAWESPETSDRVIRGCAWINGPSSHYSTIRNRRPNGGGGDYVGFRPASAVP